MFFGIEPSTLISDHRLGASNLQVFADRQSASIQSNNDSNLLHPWQMLFSDLNKASSERKNLDNRRELVLLAINQLIISPVKYGIFAAAKPFLAEQGSLNEEKSLRTANISIFHPIQDTSQWLFALHNSVARFRSKVV